MDTTEDQAEQKRLAAEKAMKKDKNKFSEKELAEPINIELAETET